MATLLPCLYLILTSLHLPSGTISIYLTIFSLSMLFWKFGRSAWLGWFRLERLHRVLEQEKWEIEHHRQQERDELRVLYAAKGFEGKLLEDVLDVLMADNSRLLKVMIEEELGLSLASHEHPLLQGLGAFVGVLLSSTVIILSEILFPLSAVLMASIIVIIMASYLFAKITSNQVIPAIVWNLGLFALTIGTVYFSLAAFKGSF